MATLAGHYLDNFIFFSAIYGSRQYKQYQAKEVPLCWLFRSP